jgi:16S rRNA (cytosine1402-N4)-methyltransferase
MDPGTGLSFVDWLRSTPENKLAEILYRYAEEPRAKPLAKAILSWSADVFVNAKTFANRIAAYFNYRDPSRKHPATRIFQALRIAINDELAQLDKLLEWGPSALEKGGRLAIISFHSLEDRAVKQTFKKLADTGEFKVLTKKPLEATSLEAQKNSRSRSAKLRVLERS